MQSSPKKLPQWRQAVVIVEEWLCDLWGIGAIWKHLKKEWPLLRNHWLSLLIIAGLFFGGGYYARSRTQSAARNATITDLRMSIITYGYDQETHELYSDVQYVNNGRTRRTILGVTFCVRDRGENGHRLLTKTTRAYFYSDGSTTYVEPNQPLVQTYKYKLDDDLVNLTTKPGEVFGLEVVTINADGKMNFSSVETMVVIEYAPNRISIMSNSKANISLDSEGGYTKMEEPKLTPLSPTPDKGASPP